MLSRRAKDKPPVDLKPGEMICSECKGKRFITKVYIPPNQFGKPKEKTDINTCPKCYGAGKVDWVENIVGKKQDFIPMDGTSACSPVSFNKKRIPGPPVVIAPGVQPTMPAKGQLIYQSWSGKTLMYDGVKWNEVSTIQGQRS